MDAVKFSDIAETTVEGLAAPWGGPFNGKDLDGEYFSKSTDFALDWYQEIPLLYHHGRDGTMQTTKVGVVKSRALTDDGVWAEAQLDASNKYFEVIKRLIKAGKLFFSSAAPPHLIQTDSKSGEIRRWPMYELSLTPTPSNLLATASAKSDDDLVMYGNPSSARPLGLMNANVTVTAVDTSPPPSPAATAVELKYILWKLKADFDAILSR